MAEDDRHLHDRDFAQWAQAQARALREQRFDAVDADILANELERMVLRERNELSQRLEALTVKLLIWAVQPAARTDPFRALISEQRASIDGLLRSSPSFWPAIAAAMPRIYEGAIATAEQGGIARGVFPQMPVFTLDQLTDRTFWPTSLFGGRAFTF